MMFRFYRRLVISKSQIPLPLARLTLAIIPCCRCLCYSLRYFWLWSWGSRMGQRRSQCGEHLVLLGATWQARWAHVPTARRARHGHFEAVGWSRCIFLIRTFQYCILTFLEQGFTRFTIAPLETDLHCKRWHSRFIMWCLLFYLFSLHIHTPDNWNYFYFIV